VVCEGGGVMRRRRRRDTEPKTRTPHKDVGKKNNEQTKFDKIGYSRGCSVNNCEYSIFLFYLVAFFPSGRPMVIFSPACLVVRNILSCHTNVNICAHKYLYIVHSGIHS
jgi:hypothetical protein